jgi:hypothetical protein
MELQRLEKPLGALQAHRCSQIQDRRLILILNRSESSIPTGEISLPAVAHYRPGEHDNESLIFETRHPSHFVLF